MHTDPTPRRVGDQWLFPDGRQLPVIRGGADDGGDGAEGGTAGDSTTSGSQDGSGDQGASGGGLPTDVESLHRMVGDLRRENAGHRTRNKDLEGRAKRADELEDAQKSELQRATDKATAESERANTAEAKLARYEAAAAKGVPLDQAHRLVGSNREELESDAEALAALLTGSGSASTESASGGVQEKGGRQGRNPMGTETTPDVDMAKVVDDIPRF